MNNEDFSSHLFFHPRMLAVEGNDGVGKTTFYKRLQEKLAVGYLAEVMTNKEPATEIAHEAARRLKKGVLSGLFSKEDYDRILHTMILQDITSYRARMHFSNGIWLDDTQDQTRVVLNDRTWWTTVSYQYGALGVSVPAAMDDHFRMLAAAHRNNGIVHLPGVVFYITDGQGGQKSRERIKQREEMDPVYEDVKDKIVEEREKRYQVIAGSVEHKVFTVVNDYDTLEEWEQAADRKIDQILSSGVLQIANRNTSEGN